ncbi:hypothetical protein DVH24_023813 [Malus domestica]|uniref:Pectinesterase inhibitor domain-containing protein n=1 Tax=Malus domestica TaxID=3750 RepID=A0A498I3S1_MALDO|nr:hypothetical protein DVH24_023813 [Malus domestica]
MTVNSDAATQDCVSQLGEEPGQRLGVRDEGGPGREGTWISSAVTDQETCLDGLEEMGSTAVDAVKSEMKKSMEYSSNSLAIAANFKGILDKFNIFPSTNFLN